MQTSTRTHKDLGVPARGNQTDAHVGRVQLPTPFLQHSHASALLACCVHTQMYA
jgi:hypothetical protein